MKIFYFTGSGNSLYIAKRLGGELYSIPQVLKGNDCVFEDEKIGIIFPTHNMSVPSIVKEFIKIVTLKSPYIFTIMTYGGNNADAIKYFTSFAKKYGINIRYANNIAMTGNHIPLVNIEKEKSRDKNIEENINQLIKDVYNSKNYINNGNIIGPILRNTLKILNKFHPIDSPKNFSVSNDCIKCSTCIKVCPRANISYDKSKNIIFDGNCISCLACVNNCPKKAIKVKGDKNPNHRYRNEHISLKEIIESNIQ